MVKYMSNCYRHCWVWKTNQVYVFMHCPHCGNLKRKRDENNKYVVNKWLWTPQQQEMVDESQQEHVDGCWHKKRKKASAKEGSA